MRNARRVPAALLALALALVWEAGWARGEDGGSQGGAAVWMSADEVRAELVGRPAAGIYPGRIAWSETMHASGRADYVEQGTARTGTWSFNASGELCFRYDNNQGGGCFRYVRIGPNCFEHFFQIAGRDLPLGKGPDPRFSTNGKLWRTTEPATCGDRPSV